MPPTIYYPPNENGLQKLLDSDLSSGITASLTLTNTNQIQNKPGVIVIDRVDSNGALKDAADREYIAYTAVSGNTLTGLTRGVGNSTDQDHSTGAVVEFVPDVTIFDAIADNMLIFQTATAIGGDTENPITGVLDEDDMASDSAVKVPTQQSVKAYVDPSTSSITSSATPTPTGDSRYNELYITALATDPTFAAPSGTPANGNRLTIRIEDDGTGRTLAWNAIYEAAGVDLPTATTASKKLYVGFIYNSADSVWDCVASSEEA